MANSRNASFLILLAEDEIFSRICATLQLEDAGFAVLAVADAEEAFQAFEAHPEVTTVFSDINMPGSFDGLALVHMVFQRNPGIQLILTSGRGPPAQGDMPIGTSFLPKPYDGEALTAMIRTA